MTNHLPSTGNDALQGHTGNPYWSRSGTSCPEALDWSSENTKEMPNGCSLKRIHLAGGLSQSMEVVDICTGPLLVRILPERGMGHWKAWTGKFELGWESPVRNGPVHPALVNQERRGGLGWLDGFDELLCRCGLGSVGPPGKEEGGVTFTLHGRIANLPAWQLECWIDSTPARQIHVRGSVDECSLFDHNFRLTTTYSFTPGSTIITVTDQVENLAAKTDNFQLLYHLNIGRPILGKGSRVFAPIREMSPQTARASEGVADWSLYDGPTQGFTEQVYLMRLQGDVKNQTLAVLCSPSESQAIAVRFSLDSLPFFTVWKNTGAIPDGYVTGLEPATCFPNPRTFEKEQGRLVPLESGQKWQSVWSIEITSDSTHIASLRREVENLAAKVITQIHEKPHTGFTPHAST